MGEIRLTWKEYKEFIRVIKYKVQKALVEEFTEREKKEKQEETP